jgi:hypothetical protein
MERRFSRLSPYLLGFHFLDRLALLRHPADDPAGDGELIVDYHVKTPVFVLKYGPYRTPEPFGVGRFFLVDDISDVTWLAHDNLL